MLIKKLGGFTVLFSLSVIAVYGATAQSGTKDELSVFNEHLPNGKLIDQLLLKYETTTDPTQKQFFLVASAEQNSGLANLLLAGQDNVPANKKIRYYLEAAKYGYPIKAYHAIADIYQHGLGVEKDEFLANCYSNLAKYNSNKPLVEVCKTRYPDRFMPMPNMPLQSGKEIFKKAQSDYASFCDNFNQHNLLNPLLDNNEQQVLARLLCTPESTDKPSVEIGDIVLKDDKLYQYTIKGYLPYHQKMQDGLAVYHFNPPVSLYIYKNGELQPTKEGDKVVEDGKTYEVKNNRLVKFQPSYQVDYFDKK